MSPTLLLDSKSPALQDLWHLVCCMLQLMHTLTVAHRYLGSVLLRALIAWSPHSWRPPVKVWGCVLKLSPEGKILQLLLDPDGSRVATASAATESGGKLFLGSIMGGKRQPSHVYTVLWQNMLCTQCCCSESQLGSCTLVSEHDCTMPVTKRRPTSAVLSEQFCMEGARPEFWCC